MNNLVNNIPDSRGVNAYTRDKFFSKLLEFYAGKDLLNQIEDKFIELGECVGSELEDLALSADKNPPKLIKRLRDGSLSNTIEKHPDFIKLEKIAFEKVSKVKSFFNFEEVRIKPGEELVFIRDESITCVVHDSSTIKFKDL